MDNNMLTPKTGSWRDWIVPFFITLACMMSLQMANFGFSPLLPSIQKAFSLSYTQLGLFTGISGLVVTLCSLPGGAIVKRYGERNMMVAGAALVAIGMVILATASDFTTALSGRVIWQGAYRITFICVMTGVAMTTPKEYRSTAMGIVGASSCIGVAFGSSIGGYIEQSFGWRHAFYTYASIGVAIATFFWFLYRRVQESADTQAEKVGANPDAPKPVSAFKTPIVWAMAVLMFFGSMTSLTVVYFVPSVLKSIYQLSTVEVSFVISTGYTIGIFTNILAGWVSDRYNRWTVLGGIAAIQACCAVFMTMGDLSMFRIATIVVLSLGLCIPNQVYAVGGIILKGRDVGPIMGVVGFGSGCAAYFGPQILGILRDTTGGFNAGWFFLCGVAICVIIEVVLLKKFSTSAKDVAA